MLFRNLPIEFAEHFLWTMAYRLGKPMSYLGERKGAFIHDIKPYMGYENTKTSLGSNVEIGLHTEMAFHKIRPKYILLFCIRNTTTQTYFCSHQDILSRLDPLTKKMLRQPDFCIHPPKSYLLEYKSQWNPILLDSKQLVMANHCEIEFRHQNARLAYQNLHSISESIKSSIQLRSGDLWVLNNEEIVHGRSAKVHPNRLLKRMYVSSL